MRLADKTKSACEDAKLKTDDTIRLWEGKKKTSMSRCNGVNELNASAHLPSCLGSLVSVCWFVCLHSSFMSSVQSVCCLLLKKHFNQLNPSVMHKRRQ